MQYGYLGPRMRGGNSTFQEWSITPLSSNQYWGPNDVIKIMGNISEGLVDFYRSHLQFQVEVQEQWQPIGLIQVDSSAQSFISQTVLLSNQVEIERIQEYDTLAAALSDIGFSELICESRQGQGMGYSNIPTCAPGILGKGGMGTLHTIDPGFNPSQSQSPNYVIELNSMGTFSPVLSPQYAGTGYTGWMSAADPGSDSTASNTAMGGMAGGSYKSGTNWLSYPFATNPLDVYTRSMGRAMSVRSQYLLPPQTNGYVDAPYSQQLTAPKVENQNWQYTTMLANGFSATRPYKTSYPKKYESLDSLVGLSTAPCGLSGYSKPYSSQFSRGTNQPFLSATIPQVQMIEGKILPAPVPIKKKIFRVPLMSAILGILIPPDQFQLIPAQSLKNILLQLTLNPYACFTSGYSDIHEFDSIGMQPQNMQKRRWQINSFQWVWHLYSFNSSQITEAIKDKLYKGIVISSNFWQLSAQYQLPNGSYVKNAFQIPTNVQSLAEVMAIFLSNQFQNKSFCRKQFRLSNNITAMQIKANGSYYPLQPIQGNAGCPQDIGSGDNWNYYQLLLLSNNYLFSTNVPLPRINKKNFAINGRIYDTDAVGTLLAAQWYQKPKAASFMQYAASLDAMGSVAGSYNPDTAMGQSWFHENRYVGKAIYTYGFQPYGHSRNMIHGLDTRGYRQFDIIFNNSPTNVYPNDETMLIFTRSNVLVRFTDSGVQVLGA